MLKPMRTTIDKAGRLVIPKPLRDRLGLVGGVEVDIVETADGLSIVPVGRPALVERDGLLVVRGQTGTVLTDEDVRRLRDEGRR